MGSAKLNTPILVIDDDAQVRNIVVEYLKSFGLNWVIQAKSSQQALKLLQDPKFSVDLVLSDWEMPGVTGLTLLKAVRNNPARNQLKFVMITSQRSMERFKISQAAQYKVSAYIIKPFRAETLKTKIWEVMGWGDEEDREAV